MDAIDSKPPPPPPPPPPPKVEAPSRAIDNAAAAAAAPAPAPAAAVDPIKAANTRSLDVAGANGVNEVQGGKLEKFAGSPAAAAEPAMPAAEISDKQKADALPATAADAVNDAPPGGQRDAVIEKLGERAGVEVPPGARVEDHRVVMRSNEIAKNLMDQARAGRPGEVRGQAPLSAVEQAGLKDEKTRFETATKIGDRIAGKEALAAAFGGAENLKKVEAAWSAATPEQKQETLAAAKAQATKRSEQAEAIVAAVVPYADAAIKATKGDTEGAAKSAAVDTAFLAAGGIIGKGISKLAGAAMSKLDEVAKLFKAAPAKQAEKAIAKDADFAVRQSIVGKEGLQRQLQSEAAHAQLKAGGGEVIAGAGSKVPLRAADELAKKYGGNAADWQKVKSKSFTDADGVTNREIHAYRNRATGQLVEEKTKHTAGVLAENGLESMKQLLERGRQLFPGF